MKRSFALPFSERPAACVALGPRWPSTFLVLCREVSLTAVDVVAPP